MLKSIKKAIWGRHDDNPLVFTSSHVSDRLQIISLLIQAYKAHALFNASFGNKDDLFTTALLGVYDEHKFFVLDEISPEAGDALLREKGEVLLTGRVDGVEMRFQTHLMERREKDGVAFYKMHLPESVRFLQRRKEYRISTRNSNINFRAQGSYQNPVDMSGYVNDLSRSGIGVTVNSLVNVGKGEIIPTCRISIPGGGHVIFALEICFHWRDTYRGITRIGGRFHKIDRSSLQLIRKTINRMERAMAKSLHQ